MEFTHNATVYGEEGPVQYFVVPTQELTDYEQVFVSVWAVNKVIHPIKCRGKAAYTLSHHGVHIGSLRKGNIIFFKCIVTFNSLIKSV
jgi:hypothetical protein